MKKLIYITIFIALFSTLSNAQNFAQSPKKSSATEVQSGDEKFDRIFREARELMDKEEWKQAAAKFSEIACDCPENKQVDAALYWLAYCYNKQKMYQEARVSLDRLVKNSPNSTWADDARVMIYQIYNLARVNESRATASGQSNAAVADVYKVNQANNLLVETVAGSHTFSQQTQLDREDEIRLAAFQSLVSNDPKKGIETLGRLLQPDSKASEALKREALRTLRSRINSRYPGSFSGEITPTIIVTQINPLLRETLVKSFQNQPNTKIRVEIIYSIANINDEPSVNYLAQLYPTESDKELKKTIINSFVSGTSTFLSGQAYTPLQYWDGATWVNGRAETERTATPASVSPAQPGAGSNQPPKPNPVRELRFNSLMTIFRTEKELELRRLALSNIQRFAGWSTRDGMIDNLAQLYDSETDEKFKVSIIFSFANLAKNAQATNKLLSIAKSDKLDKMRLEAIRALRNNNSPEVIKFLEDLIQ